MNGIDIEKAKQLLDSSKSNIDIAYEKLQEIQNVVKIRGKRGYDSPFPCIDAYTQGIIEGKVYTILAFSNTGKSQLSYEYVSDLLKKKKRVLFVSTEVGTGDLLAFIARNYYRKNYFDFISGKEKINIKDFENLFLFDNVNTFEDIEKKVNEYKPDAVFIDFIQSIGHNGSSEYEIMSNLARDIQQLAIQKNITVFSLSQVSNSSRLDNPDYMMPKGSGNLFASSDVILGMYREDNQVKMTICKNKFGPAFKKFDIEMEFKFGDIKVVKSLDDGVSTTASKYKL